MKLRILENIVGIVPAAGFSNRLGQLPTSKEVYPLGYNKHSDEKCVKVVCEDLLDKFCISGIEKIYLVIRREKWDIPQFLSKSYSNRLNIAYIVTNIYDGTPYTVDQAYPFVNKSWVALGFPDILFSPNNAFNKMISQLEKVPSDVLLGLFPADHKDKVDMVDIDQHGNICQIIIKPKTSSLSHTWGIALWSAKFTEFMHHHLQSTLDQAKNKSELYLGDVIQLAINAGMKVKGIEISAKPFLDIGTPDDLLAAVALYNNQSTKDS